jgi:hypothetical protein
MLNFQAKRELLAQVALRYRDAGHAQKSVIGVWLASEQNATLRAVQFCGS